MINGVFIDFMNENRFFRVKPMAYEQARNVIDSELNLSNEETCIEPMTSAPKFENDNVAISIRSIHCNTEPFQSVISNLLANGDAIEITKNEYESVFPSGGITEAL